MPKLPYYRWYPAEVEIDGDWRAMTLEERGLFLTLLNVAWMNDGLPESLEDVARIIGSHITPRAFSRLWARVGPKFYPDGNGKLRNGRQEEERKYANSKILATSKSGTSGQSKEEGFVYLVRRSSDGSVKIGSSANVPRRLAQLRYKYTSDHLELIGKVKVLNMVEAELGLHEKFESKRVVGEWFSISQGEIESITLEGDKQYHPNTHAYDSDSVSDSLFESGFFGRGAEKPKPVPITSLEGFQRWWGIWSAVRGTNQHIQASQAYLSVVTAELQSELFACTESYLASLDNPTKGYNPQNFLFEQAKDGFRARWPARNRGQPDRKAKGQADFLARSRRDQEVKELMERKHLNA